MGRLYRFIERLVPIRKEKKTCFESYLAKVCLQASESSRTATISYLPSPPPHPKLGVLLYPRLVRFIKFFFLLLKFLPENC